MVISDSLQIPVIFSVASAVAASIVCCAAVDPEVCSPVFMSVTVHGGGGVGVLSVGVPSVGVPGLSCWLGTSGATGVVVAGGVVTAGGVVVGVMRMWKRLCARARGRRVFAIARVLAFR